MDVCLEFLLQGDYSHVYENNLPKESVSSREPDFMQRIEIIVVDDGSSDRTASVVEERIQVGWFPHLKLIRQKHSGISAARNRGLQESIGRYIWFIDADDTLEPLCLETIITSLHDCQSDLFKLGHLNTTGHHAHKGDITSTKKVTKAEIFGRYKGTLDHTTYLFRRDFLIENHIWYPENMAILEDSVMVLNCLSHTQSVLYNPTFIFYCLDGHSTTRGLWDNMCRQRFLPSIHNFFNIFKDYVNLAEGEDLIAAQNLYDRYLYVYQRVLLVKGCTMKELSLFKETAFIPNNFYYGKADFKMKIMKSQLLYGLLYVGYHCLGIPIRKIFKNNNHAR